MGPTVSGTSTASAVCTAPGRPQKEAENGRAAGLPTPTRSDDRRNGQGPPATPTHRGERSSGGEFDADVCLRLIEQPQRIRHRRIGTGSGIREKSMLADGMPTQGPAVACWNNIWIGSTVNPSLCGTMYCWKSPTTTQF